MIAIAADDSIRTLLALLKKVQYEWWIGERLPKFGPT